jgi:hypothetical protein
LLLLLLLLLLSPLQVKAFLSETVKAKKAPRVKVMA